MFSIVALILIDILGTDKKGKACALSDVFVCHVNKGPPAFLSTSHKLESPERKEPDLRLACRPTYRAFSWLMIDVEEPRPLW